MQAEATSFIRTTYLEKETSKTNLIKLSDTQDFLQVNYQLV